MEKEKYHPILETEKVKIYQRKDKTLIVGEKEFTFQTSKKILKRPRMENEKRINKLERDLFQLSRLKKEGKKVNGLIKNTEVVLFEAVDKGLEEHHHLEKWDEELTPTEKKVERLHDEHLGISEDKSAYESKNWLAKAREREAKRSQRQSKENSPNQV